MYKCIHVYYFHKATKIVLSWVTSMCEIYHTLILLWYNLDVKASTTVIGNMFIILPPMHTQALLKCEAIALLHKKDSVALSMALQLATDLVGVHHQVS